MRSGVVAAVVAAVVVAGCSTQYGETNLARAPSEASALAVAGAVAADPDLFGNLASVKEIEALGVPVLEDAAQAAGTTSRSGRAGSEATAATFSFFPSKNLGCFGDGGGIVTSDDEVAERARMLRFHGSRDKVTFEQVGYNSRLDELQAAILRVQLPHLDRWADGRRAAGEHYHAGGLGELVALPRPSDGARPAWHLFVVRSPRSDELSEALTAAGVGNRAYYRVPTHRQPAMERFGARVELPATEEAAGTHLALPMSPVLSREQADWVCAATRRHLTELAA